MSQHFLTEALTVNHSEPCPLCGGDDSVTDMYSGEEACTGCGCVLNDLIVNARTEKHNYSHGQREVNRRQHGSGARPSVFDKGLNTFMGSNKDALGNNISLETSTVMRRLQRQDTRSKVNESVMRNLSVAMAELDRLAYSLSIPSNLKDDAAIIYRHALQRDLVRGRSIDAFVAASIYAACRLQDIPRPLKTVCDLSKRTHKEVSMTYRLLLKELNLKPPLDDPLKYVSKLAHSLGIPRPTERRAITILEEAKSKRALVGKDPRGVAAAALYLASELNGEKIVQRNVAKAAETTEVTLRNRYRGLKKALSIV